MRRREALLVLLAVVGCATATPAAQSDAMPAMAGHYLYICNQDAATVSVLDMHSREIIETIDLQTLGFSANAKPHHVAVEDDGSFWYLSLIGENKVLKFSSDNELVGQADFEVPGMLQIHPTEDHLFVGRSMSAVNPPQRIGMIERSTMDVEELDVFFPRPHAIAISRDGRYAYTASLAANQLASIDLETERLELVNLDGPIHTLVQFAISPDGQTMVGTAQLTGRLLVFDLSDPAMPSLRGEIPVHEQPWHPVFTSDGRYVYFGNKTANTVTMADLTTMTVAKVIEGPGISAPHGSAASPDGRWIFISSNGAPMSMAGSGASSRPGSVVVIEAATGEVVEVIETGLNTTGLGAAAG